MSYASKAQLQALAEAIKQKFAKKIDPEAISGSAQQIFATVGVDDKVPYNFRTSGGSANIGNRLNDKIVGGTIVWNQLFVNSATSSNGVTISNNQDGTMTLNGTANKSYINFTNLSDAMNQVHKYLLCLKILNNPDNVSFSYGWLNRDAMKTSVISTGESWVVSSQTSSLVELGRGNGLAGFTSGTVFSNVKIAVMVMDLTQMFGSTLADYVYSLEHANKGAGVAWFKNLFPKPYYEYNAGELMSVCTNAHITRGFNAYDHANGTAKLVGGKQYQITGAYTSLVYSTGETISPNESGLFTLMENGVLTVTGGNATNTCVHLVWSGYRNGEYEPYVEHNYPLSPVELRGIPKLDSNNNLYFDGDTYEKDGTVTRRYKKAKISDIQGKIANGDETPSGLYRYYLVVDDMHVGEAQDGLCDNLPTDHKGWNTETSPCIRFGQFNSAIYFYLTENLTTQEELREKLNNYIVLYPLAAPATETANSFTDPQIVDDFGTEEYVDALATAETSPRDVAIPVGHETFYQANLRDKLQNLPENADADGLYLVKQTGNKQELIAYTPESELPTIQTAGTYILKSVNGVLTWVLES